MPDDLVSTILKTQLGGSPVKLVALGLATAQREQRKDVFFITRRELARRSALSERSVHEQIIKLVNIGVLETFPEPSTYRFKPQRLTALCNASQIRKARA